MQYEFELNVFLYKVSILTQPTITCSKLTIEILEEGVKYVQKLTMKTTERRQCRTRCKHILHLVLVFLLLTLSG